MSEPTGLVQVQQSDLDNFATQLNTIAGDITTATGVISNYIQTLLANQNTPLPAGDETQLTNAVTALTNAGTALDALEPPTPAPPTPTPTP
jgi:hypothetical protein